MKDSDKVEHCKQNDKDAEDSGYVSELRTRDLGMFKDEEQQESERERAQHSSLEEPIRENGVWTGRAAAGLGPIRGKQRTGIRSNKQKKIQIVTDVQR